MSTSTSTSPSSQPLRSAYISVVMAVHAASAAPTVRVGEGPALLPPSASGSSITRWCPPWISTSWVKPCRRRAVTLTIGRIRVAALEELRVRDVGEPRHREREVGRPVQVAEHGVRCQLPAVPERDDPPLGTADHGPRNVELRRERGPTGDHELRRQIDAIHVPVDDRLERLDHPVVDPADALLQAPL